MTSLEKILAIVGGIPFSAMRGKTKKSKKSKVKKSKKSKVKVKKSKVKVKSQRGGRDHLSMMKRRNRPGYRRKKKRTNHGPNPSSLRVPPKGVIIRKGDKLYRSNGTKMIFLSH